MINFFNKDMLQVVVQYGFAIPLFISCVFLLRWILKQQEKILDQARDERIHWQSTISSLQQSIEDHTSTSIAFREQVHQAHKYQREEHKGLMDLNYTISKELAQASIILSRINGSK